MLRLLVVALSLTLAVPAFAQPEVPAEVPLLDGGTALVAEQLDGGLVAVVEKPDGGVLVMPEVPIIAPLPTFQNADGGLSIGAAETNFIVSVASGIRHAVKHEQWGWLIFLIITSLVALTRGVLAPRIPILQHKLAGMILAFLWSGAGALATTWGAGEALQGSDVLTALSAGFVAMGGWGALKAVLEHFMPKDSSSNWATVVGSIFGITNPNAAVVTAGTSK